MDNVGLFGLISLAVTAGAICYVIYMARLFFFPKNPNYDIYKGLAVATFAFADLGSSIRAWPRKSNRTIL